MSDVKLSIVIPVYNVEEYLALCLDSIFNQVLSKEDYEVIAINDGSQDRSLEILEEYQEIHSNLRVYTFENSGLATTRNRGMEKAKGKYITFMDSDDLTPKKAYHSMLETIEKTGSDIVTGPVIRLEGGKKHRSGLHKEVGFTASLKTTITKTPELIYDTTSTNKIYKMSFLNEHNFQFPANLLYEDILFTQQVYVAAESIDIINDPVYIWRIRDGETISISQNRRNIKGYRDRVNTLIDVLNLHKKIGNNRSIKALEKRIIDFDLKLFTKEFLEEEQEYFNFYMEASKKLLSEISLETVNSADYRSQLLYHAIMLGDSEKCKREYKDYKMNLVFNDTGMIARNDVYDDFYVEKIDFSNNLLIQGKVDGIESTTDVISITGDVVGAHIDLSNEQYELSAKLILSDGEFVSDVRIDSSYNDVKQNIAYNISVPTELLAMDGVVYQVELTYSLFGKYFGSCLIGTPMRKGNGSKLLYREEDWFYTGDFNFGWELILRKERVGSILKEISMNKHQLTINGVFTADFKENAVITNGNNQNIRAKIDGDALVFDLADVDIHKKLELVYFNHGYRSYAFRWENFGQQFYTYLAGDDKTEYIIRKFRLTNSLTIKKDYIHSDLKKVITNKKKIKLKISLPKVKKGLFFKKTNVYLIRKNGGKRVPLHSCRFGRKVSATILPTTATALSQYQVFITYLTRSGEKVQSQVLDLKNHSKKIAKAPLGLTSYDFESADGYQLYVGSEGGMESSKLKYYFYRLMRKLPINKRKVIFSSYWGKETSCNPRAIYDYMKNEPKFKNYKFIWLINNQTNVTDVENTVVNRSFGYYYHMATAKYFFNNVNFTSPYAKRKEAVEVQTMHGTPLKTLGLDAKNEFKNERAISAFNKRNSRWDYVISQSEYVDSILKTAYNYEGKILKTGYPRNDSLMGTALESHIDKAKFNGKKVIVYVPTWRVTNKFNLQLNIQEMRKKLANDYVLVIKPHHYEADYLDAKIIDNDFVFDGREFDDLNELLVLSDLLITDYSSIIIDYLVQNKPAFIFAYDYNSYTSAVSRGLYFNMREDFKGIYSETTDELIQLIQDTTKTEEYLADIKTKFITYERPDSSKAVVESVFGK